MEMNMKNKKKETTEDEDYHHYYNIYLSIKSCVKTSHNNIQGKNIYFVNSTVTNENITD